MADKKGPNKLTESRFAVFQDSVLPSAKKPISTIFERPMALISHVNGNTTCNLDTLAELSKIEKTLNVVSVVGSLRTGKSFLLNKLANAMAGEGFETGHSTTAVTKGIWIMCRPHPTQQDQVLVLLDTEGIDDPDKVEVVHDQWLFILSTLLSSTMVYNTRGNFDRTAIEKFKFLRQIKTSVTVTGADKDDSILDFFFPTFVLTLRDFTLTIEENNYDVFLEAKLMLQRGQTDSIKRFNEPRQLIRRYFKQRKCFVFRKPAKQKLISQLMRIPESDFKPVFLETLNSFRDYIFSCQPKTLKSGRGINGRMLATLLTSYVTSIQEGNSPCLQRAMKTMTDVENKHAIEKATNVYDSEMKKRIAAYNTPSDTGLVNFHNDSMKEALDVMKKELVFDDEHLYEEEALVMFKNNLQKFKSAADKNSKAICYRRLTQLNLKIERKKNNGTYCHPAGYDEYLKDIEWVIKQYNRDAPYLGTKARTTLQEFLDGKEEEEEKVYQMVVEAQKGTKESPSTRVRRLSSLVMEDVKLAEQHKEKKAAEEEKIENEISRDIIALQIDGIRSIGGQYLEILKMKIEELERVKSELSEDDPYYESLQLETDYWKKLWEKATWNLPQYRDAVLKPVLETPTKENMNPASSTPKLPDPVAKKETDGDTVPKQSVAGEGGNTKPIYNQDFFKIKQNPAPVDPQSIDPKFIVTLKSEKAEKKPDGRCKIL